MEFVTVYLMKAQFTYWKETDGRYLGTWTIIRTTGRRGRAWRTWRITWRTCTTRSPPIRFRGSGRWRNWRSR